MRLEERGWVLGGGLCAQWAWVHRERVRQALAELRGAIKGLSRAPAGARDFLPGLNYFLSRSGPRRDQLAAHPALDYWLHLESRQRGARLSDADRRLHLGLFQGLAAALALARRDGLKTAGAVDPDGRFFFYGTPHYLSFPRESAGEAFALELGARKGSVTWKGRRLALPLKALRGPALKAPLPLGGVALESLREAAPGIVVDDAGWLVLHGVTMHGRRRFASASEGDRFAAVLSRALSDMAERAPGLHAELTDLTRVLVPLENPQGHGSVSSSYVNLRGAICLSHAEDPLLQAETLIHEFCHMKMNQLLSVDPVLLPGQGGQAFYSPWRADARRLRGLLLGAHAFLNVGLYIGRSLEREEYGEEQEIELMVNVARRAEQVETALRGLSLYGSFTEFGRRFMLRMWRELAALRQATLWYPPALLEEQRAAALEHRRRHALADTGLHKAADFVDAVRRAPFLTPGER